MGAVLAGYRSSAGVYLLRFYARKEEGMKETIKQRGARRAMEAATIRFDLDDAYNLNVNLPEHYKGTTLLKKMLMRAERFCNKPWLSDEIIEVLKP